MSATQQTLFSVPSISCNGCARSIQSILNKIAGVDAVAVDVDTKTVTVTHQEEVAGEVMVYALYAADFPATLVPTDNRK